MRIIGLRFLREPGMGAFERGGQKAVQYPKLEKRKPMSGEVKKVHELQKRRN